jgi:hypothetical protein
MTSTLNMLKMIMRTRLKSSFSARRFLCSSPLGASPTSRSVTRREYWNRHLGQKLKEAGTTAEHCGHLTNRRAPHCPQASAPWSFCHPHDWHRPAARRTCLPACAQSAQTWSSMPICPPHCGQYFSKAAPQAAQNWLSSRLELPQAGHTGPASPVPGVAISAHSGLGLRPCCEDMGVP